MPGYVVAEDALFEDVVTEDDVVEGALSEDTLLGCNLSVDFLSEDTLPEDVLAEGILHSSHNPLNDLYAACLTPPEENIHVYLWTGTNANECNKKPERDTDKIT